MRMRISGVLAVLAAVVCLAGGASGGKATIINVTTIVHDSSSGTQLLIRSDDPGAGQATYSEPNVGSYIDENGDYWYLNLYGQTTRTIWITPNDPINSSQPTTGLPPAGYYWQDVEVAGRCYDGNLNVVPFQNILTSSSNCGMIVDFASNGTEYKLAMGPVPPEGAPAAPAPGLVTVTCNARNSTPQCVSWTITPKTTVANLYEYAKHGLQFIGQYDLTFRVDVTNP